MIQRIWGYQLQWNFSLLHYELNGENQPSDKGKQVVFKLIEDKDYPIDRIKEETYYYNNLDIYIFWILNADSFHHFNKFHYSKSGLRRDLEVSELEMYIHNMLLGRVYYADLDQQKIFPCHFSSPDDIRNHGLKIEKRKRGFLRRKSYKYYYIQNANIYSMKKRAQNLNLVNDDFYKGKLLGRLFDKSLSKYFVENVLENFILSPIYIRLRKKILINLLLKKYNLNYGKFFLLDSIIAVCDINKNKNNYKSVIAKDLRKLNELSCKLKYSNKKKFRVFFPRICYSLF